MSGRWYLTRQAALVILIFDAAAAAAYCGLDPRFMGRLAFLWPACAAVLGAYGLEITRALHGRQTALARREQAAAELELYLTARYARLLTEISRQKRWN